MISNKKDFLKFIKGAGVGLYGVSANQKITFKYADTIGKAINALADNGALVFGVDSTSGAGAIWAGTELVTSKVIDYAIADSAEKDHGQKTVTLKYIGATGVETKTFNLIDEAGLKAYFAGSKTIALDSSIYEVKVKTDGGVKIDENGAGLYVDIADLFGVDASTIGFNAQNKLKTLVQMNYHAAVTTVGEEKAAYIALEDVNGNSISEIPVANIIGNGILKSATYNKANNTLVLVFEQADGTEKTVTVDMKDLIDINDIFLDTEHDADDYLTLTNDTSIATFGVTNKTKTGIALAESAIQGVEKLDVTGAGDYVSLTVAPKTGDASVIQISVNDNAAKTKFVDVDASIDRLDTSVNLINAKDEEQDASIDRLDASVNALENAIAALDATESDNVLDGSIAITVTQADGLITGVDLKATEATVTFDNTSATPSLTSTSGLVTGAAITAIRDYVDAKSGALDSSVTGKDVNEFVTVNTVQTDGALSAENVTVVYGDYDKTSQVNGIATTGATKTYVDTEIDAAINALDLANDVADASAVDAAGFVKTTISETNGIVKNESVAVTYGNYGTHTNGIAKTADTSVFVEEYVEQEITTALTWNVI